MTDLERVKEFYDWLKAKYEIETSVIGDGYNQTLTVGEKGDWCWSFYFFKDGKLVNWYMSE
jgi:hypothetical protein